MENKTLIAISTYKKNAALEELLDSLVDNQYLDHDILICDDSYPEAKDLWKSRNSEYILYTGGENLGIARNKNRALKYFVENKQYTHVLLLDDDIIFIRPGLVEALIATGHEHLTGYLGKWELGFGIKRDERTQLSGNDYFKDFPIQGGDARGVLYCGGSQGVMLFFSRRIVEECGYFPLAPGKYGFEHSLYSNTVNAKQGIHIDWFPIFENAPKYFKDNGKHPNQYDIHSPGDWHIDKNNSWWVKKKVDIYNRINYINKDPGIPAGELIHELNRGEV